MPEQPIQNIVIVGGGTAGWMCAAALSRVLAGRYTIQLVESEAIGTVGVGEGTVPFIRLFNNLLQLDEAEFVRRTQGTFKLGVQFNDWGRVGDSYMHGFGNGIGQDLGLLPFHHYWIKARRMGKAAGIGAYLLTSAAAPRGKFMAPATDVPPSSPLSNISYAYHFDAGLYAALLREYAERRGVRRTEGTISRVLQDGESGYVLGVEMPGGEVVRGDIFIDCSGFRGLLIAETLGCPWRDYTHWLPCDRAVAVASAKAAPPAPYTRSTARAAGWQWRIPLQHRVGNGYVYSSAHVSDDEAAATLLANLDAPALTEPKQLRFTTGRRERAWVANVVSLGLASGFTEPLEATSIHLIQSGISRLLSLFPGEGISPVLVERYNAQMAFEYDRIRDFLILHYHATRRDDSAFWRQCAGMQVPDELKANIELFRDSGRVYRNADEMFAEMSWVQIMLGQGVDPQAYHPLVDLMPEPELLQFISGVERTITACVDAMPAQQAFIDRHCAAAPVGDAMQLAIPPRKR